MHVNPELSNRYPQYVGIGAGIMHPTCDLSDGSQCSSTVSEIFHALFRLAKEKSSDGHSIRLTELRNIIDLMAEPSGPFEAFYAHKERCCLAVAKAAELDLRRTNTLVRILLHPVEGLLDDPGAIPRAVLPQLVSALRMMLGPDRHDALQQRATALAATHRTRHGSTDWPAVMESVDGRTIALEALIEIANRFRRFEARKDWFILLLNTNPAARTVAANSFIMRDPRERSRQRPIGEEQFATLFHALFSEVHPSRFSKDSALRFARHFGRSPQAIFGHLFVELARMR